MKHCRTTQTNSIRFFCNLKEREREKKKKGEKKKKRIIIRRRKTEKEKKERIEKTKQNKNVIEGG